MRFGIFCFMQCLGPPFTGLFDDHLAEIIHAEHLGFDEVWFAFGRLTHAQVLRSLDLFSKEIMPAVKKGAASITP